MKKIVRKVINEVWGRHALTCDFYQDTNCIFSVYVSNTDKSNKHRLNLIESAPIMANMIDEIEFVDGECIYCGLEEDGSITKEREVKSFTTEHWTDCHWLYVAKKAGIR